VTSKHDNLLFSLFPSRESSLKILQQAKKFFASILFGSIVVVALLSSVRLDEMRSLNIPALLNDPQDFMAGAIKCQTGVLPAAGTIGYIIRADGSDAEYRIVPVGYQFFLSQLLLAPRVLDRSAEHRWVIASLVDAAELNSIAARYHAQLVQDCGYGIAVFERANYP